MLQIQESAEYQGDEEGLRILGISLPNTKN